MSKNIISKICICIITILSILLTSNISKVSASPSINDYTIKLSISGDNTVNGTIQATFQNISSKQLLRSIDLNLPFQIDTVSNISIDSIPGGSNLSIIQNSTNVKLISSNTFILNPNQIIPISFNFSTNKIMKDAVNLKSIYIPAFTDNNSAIISYKIIYTNSNAPSFISSFRYNISNIGNNSSELDISTDNPLFLIFGNNLKTGITSTIDISNTTNSEIYNLIPLPNQNEIQNITYTKIAGGDLSVVDLYDNNFLLSNLASQSKKSVNYVSNVSVSSINQINKEITKKKYDFIIDKKNPFGGLLEGVVNSKDTNINKIRSIYTLLTSHLLPNLTENIDIKEVSNIWQKLNGKSRFNSFEYCYLLTAASEEMNLNSEIDYGFLLIKPANSDSVLTPHVWCSVQIDGKYLVMDPFLESIYNINYFNQPQIDRIQYGVWSPDQKYNSILGLLNNDINKKIVLNKTSFDGTLKPENLILNLKIPTQVYSDLRFSGDLSINNLTNKIINIKEINLDNNSISNILDIDNEFKQTLLPGENNININNISENSPFKTSDKNLILTLVSKLTNSLTYTTNASIKVLPDKRLIVIAIGIAVSIVSLFIITIIFFVFRRRVIKSKDF